jgi:L-threonylcarbamoyladenylate synthase
MKTQHLSIDQQAHISEAIQCLANGGVIAFPTDTVYGIAADINNDSALNKIYAIKERENTKALPILISGTEQLVDLIDGPQSASATCLANCFWPGALTLIFAKNKSISPLISQTETIGIRMPNYEPILALIRTTGPLAVTSANLSGYGNCLSAEKVLDQLEGRIDLILDGGPTPGLQASTVVDCTKDTGIEILRAGVITEAMIKDCLNA